MERCAAEGAGDERAAEGAKVEVVLRVAVRDRFKVNVPGIARLAETVLREEPILRPVGREKPARLVRRKCVGPMDSPKKKNPSRAP